MRAQPSLPKRAPVRLRNPLVPAPSPQLTPKEIRQIPPLLYRRSKPHSPPQMKLTHLLIRLLNSLTLPWAVSKPGLPRLHLLLIYPLGPLPPLLSSLVRYGRSPLAKPKIYPLLFRLEPPHVPHRSHLFPPQAMRVLRNSFNPPLSKSLLSLLHSAT